MHAMMLRNVSTALVNFTAQKTAIEHLVASPVELDPIIPVYLLHVQLSYENVMPQTNIFQKMLFRSSNGTFYPWKNILWMVMGNTCTLFARAFTNGLVNNVKSKVLLRKKIHTTSDLLSELPVLYSTQSRRISSGMTAIYLHTPQMFKLAPFHSQSWYSCLKV